MNAINNGAVALAIPSLYQIKGEVQSKQDQASAAGKKLKRNVVMKEVARKYGFRSWEALEGAVRKRGTSSPGVNVTLYTLDGFDQALIVNRKLVAYSMVAMGEAALEQSAVNLANALGVELDRDGFMFDDDSTEDGEDRDIVKSLIDLNVIDADPDSRYARKILSSREQAEWGGYKVVRSDELGDYAFTLNDNGTGKSSILHSGYKTERAAWNAAVRHLELQVAKASYNDSTAVKSDRTLQMLIDRGYVSPDGKIVQEKVSRIIPGSLEEKYRILKEEATYVPSFFGGKAPYLVFQASATSELDSASPDGTIDCIVEVILEVSFDNLPKASYDYWLHTNSEGRLRDIPGSKFDYKAKRSVDQIVQTIIAAGIPVGSLVKRQSY